MKKLLVFGFGLAALAIFAKGPHAPKPEVVAPLTAEQIQKNTTRNQEAAAYRYVQCIKTKSKQKCRIDAAEFFARLQSY